ncbi:MAG: outer membrane protein assembly factor BamC, partial [Burkholderiaceae bacterium]|nr:outer membrane protein assembly factor BamC [Burkholderiaceae bacterium]
MKSATRHTLALLAVCGLVVSGCSTFQETKVDYTSAKRINTLDVPPDLTQLSKDSRFAMPGGPVSASGYQVSQASSQATPVTAANSVGDVRIERAGSERWLVVKRPADALWEPVRGFWQDNGFVLVLDQEKLGLLETDWAENRAKLPQDFIRNTLGKLLDSLYSTGERDKFRTRLERNAAGETEIYVSHRGMVEVFTSSSKDQTMWQP